MTKFDWSFKSFAEETLERYDQADDQEKMEIRKALKDQICQMQRLLSLIESDQRVKFDY